MFMVAGASNVVRVNGRAVLTNDTNITGHFARNNRQPKLVIAITMDEVYFQCAKAVMRSDLWNGQKPPPDLPKAGQFLKEIDAEFAAKAYDEGYADYAKSRMW
jgi:hypothetical protein